MILPRSMATGSGFIAIWSDYEPPGMSLSSQFLAYVTAFRLAIIAAGVVSMVLD